MGIFGVIVALGLAGVFYFTSGMTGVADKFFKAVAEDKFDEATTHLSKDFVAATPMDGLKAYLSLNNFREYKDASWASRKISGGIGTLTGKINTRDGGAIPLEISFVKEEGGWKIQNIKKTDAGLTGAGSAKMIPPNEELVKLANAAVKDFVMAVNSADFTAFYNNSSKIWQAQTDPKKLLEAFRVFVDKKLDFSELETTEPVFNEKPELTEEGKLVLKGYYPTKQYIFHFKLSYVYEYPEWKLVGISVDIDSAK